MLKVVFKELLLLPLFPLDLHPELPIAFFDLLTNFVNARFKSQLFVLL